LSKNLLTFVPEEIFEFAPTLLTLNIGFNKLSSMPSLIGMLNQLTCLDFRNNSLSTLPKEMSLLLRLQDLILSMNQFSEIPHCLAGLPKLTNLIANDNKIQRIDVGLLQALPSLSCLDLTNNSVDAVPAELGFLPNLKSLKLEGNAFKIPRPAILAQGTPAIMEYLRNRAQ
jgi:Leucine-rich repeat (LRR) protein